MRISEFIDFIDRGGQVLNFMIYENFRVYRFYAHVEKLKQYDL